MAGNLMQRTQPECLTKSPRCQARKKLGGSCGSPAVKGKRVCRVHGGHGSGAPKGERNGMWKHGGDALEAVALRSEARRLLDALAG